MAGDAGAVRHGSEDPVFPRGGVGAHQTACRAFRRDGLRLALWVRRGHASPSPDGRRPSGVAGQAYLRLHAAPGPRFSQWPEAHQCRRHRVDPAGIQAGPDDAADDERLVDDDEFDDDDEDERLVADDELVVPDELEPLELERDARLRFVFDGESLVGFLIVSVSTVILYDKQKLVFI